MPESEKISWLELERYHLNVLAPDTRARVDEALSTSKELRACLERIRTDHRPLPPLRMPAVGRSKQEPWWRAGPFFGAAMACGLAAMVFWIRVPTRDDSLAGTKGDGSEFAFEVVREDDRFQLTVSCARPGRVPYQVTLLEEGAGEQKLSEGDLRCGNNVLIPGAFRLTGEGRTQVCLQLGGDRVCQDVIALGL